MGICLPHAAPSSAHTYGRSRAHGVSRTTSSSALPNHRELAWTASAEPRGDRQPSRQFPPLPGKELRIQAAARCWAICLPPR